MSRLEAGAVTACPIPVALDEVVSRALLLEHRPLHGVHIPDDLPFVLADPGLLERVVENLVANAVRFSPPETSGRADAGADPGHVHPRMVDLRVVDHGPGIPPERHEQVFAPFQRLDDRDASALSGSGSRSPAASPRPWAASTPSPTPGGGLTMTVRLRVAQ